MQNHQSNNVFYVLISASLLSMVLGSVHAFSVFLEPLETRFDASRSMVSLTYSMALVTLTIAVLYGYKIYAKWQPGRFVFFICILAALGALVAAYAPSLLIIWLGYSLMFGAANGLGYGFGLQIAGQSRPGHEGAVMGIVTASYGLGAAISPAGYAWLLSIGGFQTAMFGLAVVLIVVGVICAAFMGLSNAQFKAAPIENIQTTVSMRRISLLWLGFGAGVGAGLMAIGHAAGIATSLGFTGAVWVTPVLIAVCNMFGSFSGGWLVDQIGVKRLLIWLPLISAITLFIFIFQNNITLVLICFGVVGFTYGAIIAVYPATIAKMFGPMDGPRIYGKVFTAWGTAGLVTPWLAGYLYDATDGYTLAMICACIFGLISTCAVLILFKEKPQHSAV